MHTSKNFDSKVNKNVQLFKSAKYIMLLRLFLTDNLLFGLLGLEGIGGGNFGFKLAPESKQNALV